MAYNRTYYFNFVSDAGITWRLEIYDQVALSPYLNKEGTLGSNAGEMKYGSEGSKMFAPLKPSTFSFEFMVTDNTSATYIKQLKTARKERDVYVALYRETVSGSNSPIYTPYWAGQVLMDLSDDPDIPTPYPITIRAVDGIASLKYYDYLPTTTTQVATHLYTIGETYIPDPTNVGGQYESWQECTEIISNCLSYSGEFTTAIGNPSTNKIFTSVRWFNGEMPNTNIDPLAYTRIKPNLFYKKVKQENNTIQYEPKSCYDVLIDICKAWGMRMYYFSGVYYFTQINNFREEETGTQIAPDNIRTFRYNMNGSADSNVNFINRWWGKYELPLSNQITAGIYKNHKLAGGNYGLLPAFKRVTIDYLNVDNINSFTSFPLLPIGGTTAPTTAGIYWEFSSLGTYTFDGLTNALFFQRIYLDVNNNGVNAGNLNIQWVMVARPAGTGSNTLNTSPAANGWTKWMYTDWSNPNAITNKWSSSMSLLNTGNLPFQSWHSIGIGPQSIDITSGGTAMFPTFPYNSTGSNFTAGEWEIGYYVKSPTSNNSLYWSGHGRFNPTGVTNPYTSPWQNNVNYTNTAITSGINASEFAPIISGAIGSAMTTTNLEQTGEDTAFEVIEDIIMGDAGLLSAGGALQIYTGSIWKHSDISGIWGINTLTGGNSFSQQLAEDIINSQAKSIDKFTVSTTIDASESIYYNDGTANRPQWSCPFTKFKTLPSASQGMLQKNFIMHTGSYNFLNDTWKWVLYEQKNFAISSTTTTTNTGGINSGVTGGGLNSVATTSPAIGQLVMPRNSNPVAGLEFQSSLLMRQKVDPVTTIRVASLITRTLQSDPYEQTITSLSITKLTNQVFKTGDKIVLQTQTNELQDIPAEETNPDYKTNRISFVVSANQLANATSISVISKTIYQDILVGDTITFDVENLISQYQNKTEGSIAGFEVDANGLTKGGIEITGWLDSDTMTGATANNVPTSLSVKRYIDNSHPAEDQTLQEVTDNGNTTTNSVMIGSSSTPSKRLDIRTNGSGDGLRLATSTNLYFAQIINGNSESFPYGIINLSYGGTTPVRISALSNELQISGGYTTGGKISFRTASTERMRLTDTGLGIGTTSPTEKLEVNGNIKISPTNGGNLQFRNGTTPITILCNTYNIIGAAGSKTDFNTYIYGNNPYSIWTNNTNRLSVTGVGNVGIGTSSPAHKLDISGGKIQINDGGATWFGSDGTGGFVRTFNGNTFRFLDSSGGETMRIDNTNDKVGIGTTSPLAKLDVRGSTTGSSASGLIVKNSAGNMTLGVRDDGVVQVPTGYFWAQHTSGMYSTGSIKARGGVTNDQGTLGIGGGGSLNALNITSAGNVGIGTTSPSEKLEVVGKAIIRKSGSATAHGDTDLLVTDATAASSTAAIQILGGNAGFSNLQFSDTNSYSQGAIMYGHTDNYMAFKANAAERMRITSAGNFLIGTTTDTGAKFHINSDFTQNDIIFTGASGGTQNAYINFNQAGNNSLTIGTGYNSDSNKIEFAPKGSVSMTLLGSGKVGIGTTNPSQLFEINGGSGQLITTNSHQRLFITSSPLHQSILYFGDTNSNSQGRVAYDNNYDDMYFNTAGAERMRIKSTGNVGIGKSSPGVKLDVDGQIRSDDSFLLQSGTTAIGSIRNQSGALDIRGDSTRDVSLGSVTSPQALFVEGTNGNVGIGITTPTHPLQVEGNARVRGDLMVGNSSPTNTPNATLHIKASGTDAKLRIEDLDNANKFFDFLVDEGNGLYIKEESNTRISIKEGGNVGIGTETPSKELEVNGNTLITGGLKVNAADIDFTGLGTSDPGVVGRLYIDRGFLRVSAG